VLPSFSRYVPLPLYLTNLTSFLTSVTDGKTYPFVPNIILITPPPLLQSMMPDPESRAQRELTNTKKYRQGVLDLASEWKAESAKEEWRVGVIDVWEAIIQDAGGEGEELRPYFTYVYLSLQLFEWWLSVDGSDRDGLHLSAKGYEVLWKEYTKLVKGEFKGRGLDWDVKEGLPWAAPEYVEIRSLQNCG